MQLNAPVTSKLDIGPMELRLSPLANAGLQTSEFSVGATESTSIEQNITSSDAKAGFPQQPIDTAITEYGYTLNAVLLESSRRNLNILFGNGVTAYDTSDVHGTVSCTQAILDGATSITVTLAGSGTLAAGDTVTIYDEADPTNVNVAVVNAYNAGAVTLETTTPLKANNGAADVFAAGTLTAKIYKNVVVYGGAIVKPVYFAVRLVSLDRATGRPKVYDIWKATLAGTTTLNRTVTDWAKPQLSLRMLKPTLKDIATGGALASMALRIQSGSIDNTFAVADVSDAATG